jgi:hypothetical protein
VIDEVGAKIDRIEDSVPVSWPVLGRAPGPPDPFERASFAWLGVGGAVYADRRIHHLRPGHFALVQIDQGSSMSVATENILQACGCLSRIQIELHPSICEHKVIQAILIRCRYTCACEFEIRDVDAV